MRQIFDTDEKEKSSHLLFEKRGCRGDFKIKSIIIVFIFVLSVTALTLFAIQIKNKPLNQSKQAEPALISEAKPEEVNMPRKIKIASEEINKIEQYAKEFNMPTELKEELMEAVTKGTVDTQWGKKEITKKELDEAGLSLEKIAKQKPDSRTENITAGYRVSGASFNKMLAACLPAKDDNEQTKELKNQALAMLEFSALAKGNNPDIPETPVSDIPETPVPDIPEMSMLELEKALLFLKDGYSKEAWERVTKVLKKYQDDKEFVEISEALLENIKKYE